MMAAVQGAPKTLAYILAVLVSSGCAATRSTIDVTTAKISALPESTPRMQVAIIQVVDARQFEAAPRNPSTPSLKSADDLKNPQIRARAVARKRGGFGQAMADILLPEGRTVEQVVREAATKALRDKGYGVVDSAASAPANALPLEIVIKQYWAWFTPGFASISIEFEGIVTMKGDMLADSKEQTVRGYAIVKPMAATDTQWSKTLEQGNEDLIANIKAALRDP